MESSDRWESRRLRGTVAYPEATQYRESERSPASRVREIRTHGFHGSRMETRPTGEESRFTNGVPAR